jgi:NADPH:quinone reductase-like Zn-dependent oxidoreductase
MRVFEMENAFGLENLRLAHKSEPEPGSGQLVVGMKAASLNRRDLMAVEGTLGVSLPLIPFSDGAGVVEAVGDGVDRVRVGDRVCPLFFQSWMKGPIAAGSRTLSLGGSVPGVLQEHMLLDAEGVVRMPDHLSFEEAATLPCAALTAWRAVSTEAQVQPGDTILVQGTGGVSMFALQFAKALGARVIATSSSDEKLAFAKKLGADHLINYRTTPDWGQAALDLTGGRGVDVVVEVGGASTLSQSLSAARVGGVIVVVGVLTGFTDTLSIPLLFTKNVRMLGITVGSREHFESMGSALSRWKIHPVIDRTYPFEEVPAALGHMQAGTHVGKICVTI